MWRSKQFLSSVPTFQLRPNIILQGAACRPRHRPSPQGVMAYKKQTNSVNPCSMVKYNRGHFGRAIRKMWPYGKAAYNAARTVNRVRSAVAVGRRVTSAAKAMAKAVTRKHSAYPKTVNYRKGGAKKFRKKVGNAQFMGRFRPVKRNSGKSFAKFNKNGVVMRKELTGTVDDPDCVYMLNEAVASYDLVRMIISAIIRHLFEKAGIRCVGMTEYFPTTLGGVSSTTTSHRVYLSTINMSTKVVTTVAGPTTTSNTLYSITTAFFNTFMNYCSGFDNVSGAGNVNNMEVLHEMYILNDADGTCLGQIRLDEVEIEVKGLSTIKIQNRTLAGDSSADAEDVANSPVEGRLYLFNGIPKHKGLMGRTTATPGPASTNQVQYFNLMPVDYACKTWGAAAMTGVINDFKEPPPPTAFYNCKGSTHVFLLN